MILLLNFESYFSSYRIIASPAQNIKYLIQNLKKIENSKCVGNICEHIAKMILLEKYPPETHIILKNINYSIAPYNGELDIVVVDKLSSKAIIVAEVKCKKNLRKASDEADKQLLRFKNAINHFRRRKKEESNFKALLKTKDSKNNLLNFDNFYPLPKMIKISYRSQNSSNFDFQSIPYSRKEILSISRKIK